MRLCLAARDGRCDWKWVWRMTYRGGALPRGQIVGKGDVFWDPSARASVLGAAGGGKASDVLHVGDDIEEVESELRVVPEHVLGRCGHGRCQVLGCHGVCAVWKEGVVVERGHMEKVTRYEFAGLLSQGMHATEEEVNKELVRGVRGYRRIFQKREDASNMVIVGGQLW